MNVFYVWCYSVVCLHLLFRYYFVLYFFKIETEIKQSYPNLFKERLDNDEMTTLAFKLKGVSIPDLVLSAAIIPQGRRG